MKKTELSADWAFEYALKFAEETHSITFSKSPAKAAPKKKVAKTRAATPKGKHFTKK